MEAEKLESLEEVISGADEVVEEKGAVVEQAADDVADKPEEEPEEDQQDSPPESAKEDKRDIPIQALLDEREKRQKAQQKAEELERRIAELSKKPDDEMPDVFEDQKGAFEHFERKLELSRLQDRIDMSREFMAILKDDYTEMEAEFLELAKDDPTLAQKLKEHPNPAKYAYDTAVKHRKFKEMENLDEWEAKKEAEIRERVIAELEKEREEASAKESEKRESVTPSLAKGRSSGGNKDPVDESLGDILGG